MIKLSRLTDYAVVILTEMGREKGVIMSVSSLSERTKIPEPTVSKALKLLTKHGVVNSTRGINGGYSLDIDSCDVLVSDIVEAMEGPIALTACVDSSSNGCSIEDTCILNNRWTPVNVAVRNALSGISLNDLVPNFINKSMRA
jgi:FeS assembly SUF system regulator